jgi:hypothetical protein
MSSDRLKFLWANASFLFRSRQELVMLILWMIIIHSTLYPGPGIINGDPGDPALYVN